MLMEAGMVESEEYLFIRIVEVVERHASIVGVRMMGVGFYLGMLSTRVGSIGHIKTQRKI